jgi:SAM-dependent methyltransferase
MKNIYNEILSDVYGARFQEYGATAKGSFWLTRQRQEVRFHIIAQEVARLGDGAAVDIADIGCGYGAFANYLLEKGDPEISKYTGYDICPQLIEECREQSQSIAFNFEVGSAPIFPTMFTVMSGTYNLSATSDIENWEKYVFNCLERCWTHTTVAMIFNLQIEVQSMISKSNIYYASKVAILEACTKRFGPAKVILNNEIPKDATFVIVRAGK